MLVCLAFAIASGHVCATPEQPSAEESALILQKARQVFVSKRGAEVHYTKKWALDDLPAYVPTQKVSGVVRLWGSNYFEDGPLGKYWEDGFRKYHPDVSFTHNLISSGMAIPGLVTGMADIGLNHKITWKELLIYQRLFNTSPLEITVVHGSLDVPGWSHAGVIIVNKDNPISQLTFKQLDGIFGAERSGGWDGTRWYPEFARGPEENIRTWGQLGLTGEWKDKPIHVYGLNLKYDAADDFARWVLKGSDKWNENMRLYANFPGPDGSFRFGEQLMVQDLSKDKYGIGFGPGIGDLSPQTKVLSLAEKEGSPYVAPTLETCRDATYPMHEEVYAYVNRQPGTQVDPKVKEFLRFILSREGQDAVQKDGKYLPLTAAVVRAQLEKLK